MACANFSIIPTNAMSDEIRDACDNGSYSLSPEGTKTLCRFYGNPSCFDSYETLTCDEIGDILYNTEVDFWNPRPDWAKDL